MSLKKMVSFRLLLLGAIVTWIALGAPRLESMLLNGLIVGIVFYILTAWIDYRIGKRLSDFLVITFIGGGLAIAAIAAPAPEEHARIFLWASCVLVGYGAAGIFALFAVSKRRNNDQSRE